MSPFAASAITITEEREAAIDFTSPYFDADQSLLVKADSGYTSLNDFVGKNLPTATTEDVTATELAGELKASKATLKQHRQ